MTEKVKGFIMTKINHTTFNVLVGIGTAIMLFLVVSSGQSDYSQILSLFTGIMFNVSLFLGIAFGLQFFQYEIGTDIQKEVYQEHNIAAAVYQGLLFVSIAIVISKGLM